MRLFGTLYARALTWARHPRAVYYLCGLSFVEAFIFPIMPEVMLAPMMLGKRHKAFFYANLSLVFSLLGSLVGYALGHWAFQALHPVLEALHLLAPIEQGVESLRAQMNTHWLGLLVVLALLIRIFGERAERILHKHIERIGWAAVVILAGLLLWWVLRH